MKTFRMLVQREFWEHRTLWITPLLVAALILMGVAVQGEWHNIGRSVAPGGGGSPQPPALFGVLNLEALFFVAAGLVAAAYLMDCLYAERRDRSILFWRSLPVSDRATVLAKFFVATIAVPALFYLAAVATSALALQWEKLRDASAPMDWGDWLQLQGLLLYTTIATVLWYAPYAAYLMLVSAWARRSVFAWAVTPPLLVALIERVVFGTTYVGRIVQRGFNELYRLASELLVKRVEPRHISRMSHRVHDTSAGGLSPIGMLQSRAAAPRHSHHGWHEQGPRLRHQPLLVT